MSLADAKALLNGRVWRTEINAAVNEGVYGTDYAHVEKQFRAFLGAQWLTSLRKRHICPFGLRGAGSGIEPGGAKEGGGTVLPAAGGRKRKETATPEPEVAVVPKGPRTAGLARPLAFPAAMGNSG